MSTYAAYYIPVTLQGIKFNRKKTQRINVAVFLTWWAEWALFFVFC